MRIQFMLAVLATRPVFYLSDERPLKPQAQNLDPQPKAQIPKPCQLISGLCPVSPNPLSCRFLNDSDKRVYAICNPEPTKSMGFWGFGSGPYAETLRPPQFSASWPSQEGKRRKAKSACVKYMALTIYDT